jgi:TonB family protein
MPTVALFSTDDYPLAAISKGEEGSVKAELVISPAGRVDGCRILESSNSAALDVATCTIMQRRARYTPARDNIGRPIEDRQTVKIHWKLDDPDGPAPFNSWAYRTLVRLDERNRPVGCRYEYGVHGVDLANCEAIFGQVGAVLAERRDLPVGRPATLTFEYRFEANPTPAAAPMAVPGRVAISTDTAEFEVTPKGKLVNCRSVVREGRPSGGLCKTPFNKRFAKAPGAMRTGRMSAAIYVMPTP